MSTTSIYTIKTTDDVKIFLHHLIAEYRLNFHPDTEFNDYVNKDGTHVFSHKEATKLDRAMDKCFRVCAQEKADIYEIGTTAFKEWEFEPEYNDHQNDTYINWPFIEGWLPNYDNRDDVARSNDIARELELLGDYKQSEPYSLKVRRSQLYKEGYELNIKLMDEAIAAFKVDYIPNP